MFQIGNGNVYSIAERFKMVAVTDWLLGGPGGHGGFTLVAWWQLRSAFAPPSANQLLVPAYSCLFPLIPAANMMLVPAYSCFFPFDPLFRSI